MELFVATVDVGTTSLKAALLSPNGSLHHPQTMALQTWSDARGAVEQQPEQWYRLLADVAQEWWRRGVDPASIQMIAMTGQMQNLIPVDQKGKPLSRALLYSDVRASAEADGVNLRFGEMALREVVGNPTTAASLLPKMIFWKHQHPDLFARTHKILFGAKDYLINALCGKSVCDPTTASTTGLLSIHDRTWYDALLESFGFSRDLMPTLCAADEVVGRVSDAAAAVTGFLSETPLIGGVGDAAATGMGAGAAGTSAPYLYVGTTGWVAQYVRASKLRMPPADGLFTLCSQEPDSMIRIAPVLNAGNVLAWALTLVGRTTNEDPERFFPILEAEASKCDDAGTVTFVPYVSPERCPITTLAPHGAFVGVSAQTTRAQMLRAIFDGVAQSLRWCGDLLDIAQGGDMIAIGGGTRSGIFMQSVADAFGKTLHLRPNSDLLAAMGVATLAARHLGWTQALEAYGERESSDRGLIVLPDEERSIALRRRHSNFRRLAETITSMSAESS